MFLLGFLSKSLCVGVFRLGVFGGEFCAVSFAWGCFARGLVVGLGCGAVECRCETANV
jgi:hypothetical protein